MTVEKETGALLAKDSGTKTTDVGTKPDKEQQETRQEAQQWIDGWIEKNSGYSFEPKGSFYVLTIPGIDAIINIHKNAKITEEELEKRLQQCKEILESGAEPADSSPKIAFSIHDYINIRIGNIDFPAMAVSSCVVDTTNKIIGSSDSSLEGLNLLNALQGNYSGRDE